MHLNHNDATTQIVLLIDMLIIIFYFNLIIKLPVVHFFQFIHFSIVQILDHRINWRLFIYYTELRKYDGQAPVGGGRSYTLVKYSNIMVLFIVHRYAVKFNVQ